MGLRVLAAMSGGVDSATAAARAVDAGHEVTGVHLALSPNPQSYRTGARGCCTLEDARDARRAADVIGIPFYVWDMAERFARDVVDDFVAEYAAGRTPNPCLRCNEKIKFAAVLDRALALGFDAVCTGHYARIDSATGALQPRRRPGQGPVLRARGADQGPDRARDVPARRHAQGAGPRGGRATAACSSPTSRTATTSASSPTATPSGFLSRKLGVGAGHDRRRRTARCSARTTARYGFTVGQRKGLRLDRPAPDGRPRYVLSIEPVSQHRHRRPGRRARRPRDHRDPPGLDRLRAAVCAGRVHGPAPRPRRGLPVRRRARPATSCTSTCASPARGVAAGPGRRPLRRRHGPGQRHHLRAPADGDAKLIVTVQVPVQLPGPGRFRAGLGVEVHDGDDPHVGLRCQRAARNAGAAWRRRRSGARRAAG